MQPGGRLKDSAMGVFRGRNDRRSGKDRRTHVDPRYRSSSYPDFVDRREGVRRHPEYGPVHGHPTRKWIILIGAVVAGFLIYIFFFTCFFVSNKCPDKSGPKRTITFGYYDDAQRGQPEACVYSLDLS
jgi:hypothetical protein